MNINNKNLKLIGITTSASNNINHIKCDGCKWFNYLGKENKPCNKCDESKLHYNKNKYIK